MTATVGTVSSSGNPALNERAAGAYLPSDGATKTMSVGGVVIKTFGRLPKRGETTRTGGITFRVLRADERRVHLLRVLSVERADS
jgi:Mg2+/Co2+ transporter CorC